MARVKITNKKVDLLEKKLDMKDADILEKYHAELTEKGLTKMGADNIKKREMVEKRGRPKGKQGEAGSKALSKYRQQVRDALELKNKLDTTIEMEDSDSDEETPPAPIPAPVIQTQPPPQAPAYDMTNILSEIENLKKHNKDLENKLTYKAYIADATNLRRNMFIKF